MRTLRSRLILSHILPLLIVVPLIGIVLIYILETQVVLADLSNDLAQQAAMTAEMAADQPQIWDDAAQAQVFVTRYSASHQSEVRLLDSQGNLLASNDPDDAGRRVFLLDDHEVVRRGVAEMVNAQADMEVFTDSEAARDAQRQQLEFTLLNHPVDCPICDQGALHGMLAKIRDLGLTLISVEQVNKQDEKLSLQSTSEEHHGK